MRRVFLFVGIHSVDFDQGNAHIVAMKSLEGEVVPLKNHVKITPDVEVRGIYMLHKKKVG